MIPKLFKITLVVLLCSGCATDHVRKIGRYNDTFTLKKIYNDNNHFYLQIDQARGYYTGTDYQLIDRYIVVSDQGGLARRIDQDSLQRAKIYKDDRGRDFLRQSIFCGRNFAINWEKYPAIFSTDTGSWVSSDGKVSSSQLRETSQRSLWQSTKEMSDEEYQSLPKIPYTDKQPALQLRCMDEIVPGMDSFGVLASILLFPPALIFDIVTAPIQAIMVYSSLSNLK